MKQWNFEDFIQTDAWRPDKDNKAVQIFMSRMHARREQLKKHGAAASQFAEPEPGERFSYVIVEKQVQFDIQGHRTDSSRKGDKMEYVSEAKAKNLPIDILFYINNYVLGLCARFINENEEFQPLTTSAIRMNTLSAELNPTYKNSCNPFTLKTSLSLSKAMFIDSATNTFTKKLKK